MNFQAYTSSGIIERYETGRTTDNKSRFIVSGNSQRPVQKISGMRGAITASVLLVLLSGSYIYIMHSEGRRLNAVINLPSPITEKMDVKSKSAEEKMLKESPPSVSISIAKPQINGSATINIYQDPTLSKIFILIKDLPISQPGQQYQLWAVSKGKHQSLGFFDPGMNDILILDMNKVHKADSFVVTIKKTNTPVEPDSTAIQATIKAF